MKIRIHTTSPNPSGTTTPTRRRSVAAFTLIEIVVATLLAAIMVPTLYAGLGFGFSMLQAARENLRATQILVQRMEAVRLSSFKAIQDPAFYPTNATEYFCPSDQTNGHGGTVYTITYNCAPGPASLPPSYRTNMMLITVTATWQSGRVQESR